MSYRKEILTAVGTLGCAIGIGFVMQSSQSAQDRYGEEIADDESVLEVQSITLTAAEYDSPIARPSEESSVTTVGAPLSVLPPPETSAEPAKPACEVVANARPVAAAMVNLTMAAPCYANERVTVHHNGMIFTQTTSATGTLDVKVPALAEDALFVIAFSNGEGGVAQTKIEDLNDFDRIVLQWKGKTGFEIHALEFGADYGEAGHIWAGAMRDVSFAAAGHGGFMTRHGDETAADPLVAEVYTFPRSEIQKTGLVNLSVEAEVNAENCNAEIEAKTLQMHGRAEITSRDLRLSVPDCDAVGSFLVLNNLLEDLKVAGN